MSGGELVRNARIRTPGVPHPNPLPEGEGTSPNPLPEGEGTAREWQLFVGNRDYYGFSFKWIAESEIIAVSHPCDVLRLERREKGALIGLPVSLYAPHLGDLPAGDERFDERLSHLLSECGARWKAIRRIERGQIGAINAQLENLRLQRRTLERRNLPDAAPELTEIDRRVAALTEAYEELAAQVRELRSQQQESTLTLQLLSGQRETLPLGDIKGRLYPNRLSGAQRVGHFCLNGWRFLTEEPRNANTEGGIFPALFGTFVMTLLLSIVVMPFGVVAAVYLREYARQGLFVRLVRIAVNNLAGVPSIVFGVFGLGFFVYTTGGALDSLFFRDRLPTPTFGTGGVLWASLTLALMTVPVVIVATEEGLAAVPRGMREASLACGASQWQTVQRVVLPAASPGMLTGLILAMARGAGEVAPLMLVGVVKLAPSLPLDGLYPFIHLERKFMHLGFHIYDLGFQSPDSEAAQPMVFATTLLLIVLVVMLNLARILIRERLRKVHARRFDVHYRILLVPDYEHGQDCAARHFD
ncbi:phosphate ABC transporter permease PstA [bacterium]|nr:phosphate ABC transporter permease PstA [bacterium]